MELSQKNGRSEVAVQMEVVLPLHWTMISSTCVHSYTRCAWLMAECIWLNRINIGVCVHVRACVCCCDMSTHLFTIYMIYIFVQHNLSMLL